MPVSTRLRSRNPSNEEELRPQTSHIDVPQGLSSTEQDSALNNQRFDRDISASRNVPISTIENSTSVPPQTLPQQQMGDPELRELIIQLSESQSSILAILQSLTEPHSGENLNSLHSSAKYKAILETAILEAAATGTLVGSVPEFPVK